MLSKSRSFAQLLHVTSLRLFTSHRPDTAASSGKGPGPTGVFHGQAEPQLRQKQSYGLYKLLLLCHPPASGFCPQQTRMHTETNTPQQRNSDCSSREMSQGKDKGVVHMPLTWPGFMRAS